MVNPHSGWRTLLILTLAALFSGCQLPQLDGKGKTVVPLSELGVPGSYGVKLTVSNQERLAVDHVHSCYQPDQPLVLGIPRHLGQAAVLGEPYFSLWPGFQQPAAVKSGLVFLSTTDWQRREEASDLAGGIPDPITQRLDPQGAPSEFGGVAIRWNRETPPIWPFEDWA